MASVVVVETERNALRVLVTDGCGRHPHHTPAIRQGWAAMPSMPGAPAPVKGPEGVGEGGGELHLVQQNERVVPEEARMHGSHARGHAVSPEQQAGSHLVHSGERNDRAVRPLGPLLVTGHPAAEHRNLEGRLLRPTSETGAQASSDRARRAFGRPLQSCLYLAGMLRPLIHHDAPIYDEDDPPGKVVWAMGQGEERHIDSGGLPHTRGEIQEIGPATLPQNLLRKPSLPWERRALMDVLEVRGEVDLIHVHDPTSPLPSTGRNRPKP